MPLRFLSLIEQLPLFQKRSAAEVEGLLKGGEEVVTKHRESLFHAGEKANHFYIVVQGAFKLVRSGSDGHKVIVHFATPGDVIGALVMSPPNAVYPVSTVSMGLSIVLKIPRETFSESWSGNSSVQQYMSGNLFSRMNHIQAQKAMAKAPLSQKIAGQLVSLIERYSGADETILPIPLTRQEMADAVGASVESVIRVMSDWSHKGYISTSDQLIQVERMDKILEVIKGSP